MDNYNGKPIEYSCCTFGEEFRGIYQDEELRIIYQDNMVDRIIFVFESYRRLYLTNKTVAIFTNIKLKTNQQ